MGSEVQVWRAVGTDAVGGVYMTGYGRDVLDHPVLTTRRLSVVTNGAGWSSRLGADAYARDVRAIAVRGLTVAIAGYDRVDGLDNDHVVHVWSY
jgi:hypothetical protein